MDDDLSAQDRDLRPRQTKRSPHAPEKLTPTPAVNLRVDITHFLAQGLEGTGSLSVARMYSSRSSSSWMHPDVETIIRLIPQRNKKDKVPPRKIIF